MNAGGGAKLATLDTTGAGGGATHAGVSTFEPSLGRERKPGVDKWRSSTVMVASVMVSISEPTKGGALKLAAESHRVHVGVGSRRRAMRRKRCGVTIVTVGDMVDAVTYSPTASASDSLLQNGNPLLTGAGCHFEGGETDADLAGKFINVV